MGVPPQESRGDVRLLADQLHEACRRPLDDVPSLDEIVRHVSKSDGGPFRQQGEEVQPGHALNVWDPPEGHRPGSTSAGTEPPCPVTDRASAGERRPAMKVGPTAAIRTVGSPLRCRSSNGVASSPRCRRRPQASLEGAHRGVSDDRAGCDRDRRRPAVHRAADGVLPPPRRSRARGRRCVPGLVGLVRIRR